MAGVAVFVGVGETNKGFGVSDGLGVGTNPPLTLQQEELADASPILKESVMFICNISLTGTIISP